MATRVERVLPLFVSAANAAGETDRELLARFGAGDETAFAVLVARHAKMVLGVCRRVLPTVQDAEDACQATFLVLSRKAAAGDWQASVANWLYGTARRIAARANRTTRRRAKREARPAPPDAPSALDQMTGREAFAALDAELDRLPPMYRAPLVLCHLEGLTRDEAAARLGVPLATLKSRLDRGRKRLADALAKRGVGLGAGLLAVAATSPAGASLPRLLDSILATVGGHPPETVAALATGVTVNTWTIKGLLAATAALVGFGLASMPTAAEQPKPAMKAEKKADPKDEVKKSDDKPKERTITGKVLGHDGKPVAAELAMHWTEGTVQTLGKTNPDGTFKLTLPLKKKWMGGELVATAAGCGPDFHYHGYDWQPASITPTADLTFKLPKGRAVKGRLINQEGKPVAGATVAAHEVSAYDSDASLDAKLKKWAERADGNPLHGDRGMQYPKTVRAPSATTDADGRFELAGYGAGQTVQLKVSGEGIAVKGLVCVNRDGFDAAPLIEAAIRNAGKNHKFNARWLLYGPDLAAVVEPEKLIRGQVTDHEGNPRVGVRVRATRTNSTELTDHWYWHEGTTDRDGKYVIRGVRKYPAYTVEVDGDPKSGQLPLQASAKDTVGYEPISLDAKSARGVVVSGRVTNKATGRPVQATVDADVMADNPFVDKYPTLLQSGSGTAMNTRTDTDGGFRLVVLPGRVLVMVRPDAGRRTEFRPPQPDPDHATLFRPSDGTLEYDSYRRGRRIVQGNWCKVLDTKPTETEVAVKVELEPATKTPVRVVDADGKPMTGVKATGVTHIAFDLPTDFPDTDTLTVFNLEAKKERVLAVIHEPRKLVGTLTLTADTKNPQVKLGSGGSVTGKAVDADGKPLSGLTVQLMYPRREAQAASDVLKKAESIVTDANGEFRIDTLFPSQEFRLFFSRGKTRYDPDYDKAPKHTVAKHGDTLKLGDLKLEPATTDGE